MRARLTTIHGVVEFLPSPIEDHRGYNMRIFADDLVAEHGIDPVHFLQENQVFSQRGVVRALHSRRELKEGKLVSASRGSIFDVAVDVRPWSPTYLTWESFILDDVDWRQVWLPPGVLHGHQVVSDGGAMLRYRTTERHDDAKNLEVAWDDPDLAIPWPITDDVILSDRDRNAPKLSEVEHEFVRYFGAEPPS